MCEYYALIKVEMADAKDLDEAVVISQGLVDELLVDELIDTDDLKLYVQEVGRF